MYVSVMKFDEELAPRCMWRPGAHPEDLRLFLDLSPAVSVGLTPPELGELCKALLLAIEQTPTPAEQQ